MHTIMYETLIYYWTALYLYLHYRASCWSSHLYNNIIAPMNECWLHTIFVRVYSSNEYKEIPRSEVCVHIMSYTGFDDTCRLQALRYKEKHHGYGVNPSRFKSVEEDVKIVAEFCQVKIYRSTHTWEVITLSWLRIFVIRVEYSTAKRENIAVNTITLSWPFCDACRCKPAEQPL